MTSRIRRYYFDVHYVARDDARYLGASTTRNIFFGWGVRFGAAIPRNVPACLRGEHVMVGWPFRFILLQNSTFYSNFILILPKNLSFYYYFIFILHNFNILCSLGSRIWCVCVLVCIFSALFVPFWHFRAFRYFGASNLHTLVRVCVRVWVHCGTCGVHVRVCVCV